MEKWTEKRTEKQTEKQTESSIYIAAMSQLKKIKNKYVRHINTAVTMYYWDHVLLGRYSVGTIEKKMKKKIEKKKKKKNFNFFFFL